LLSPQEIDLKTQIWLNDNEHYLRSRQEKAFKDKMAAANPAKKPTRRRTRKPRIGEGQTTPASTPGEAAVEVMNQRNFSKRLNYDAMRRMLDRPKGSGPGSVVSEFASRQTSRAGSSLGAGDDYQGGEGAVGDGGPEDEDMDSAEEDQRPDYGHEADEVENYGNAYDDEGGSDY